jgi:hypothetical protein
MFDWSAPRPPRTEEPILDRPTIPLTAEERRTFESLSRQARAGRAPSGKLAALVARAGGWAGLPAGLVLVIGGGIWCLAWLTTSVVVSFLGVLVQAVGLGVVLDAERLRRRRAGSAARPAASRAQTHAHRRQDR